MMGAFDKDKPASSTSLRNSNPEMLANNAALETALDQDHDFTTGSTQTGRHNMLTLLEAADIGTGAAGVPILGAQTANGKAELVFTDEDDNDVQITKAGDLNASANLNVVGTTALGGSATLAAGADLIGSATSDITINTNKFTVAGATGNTVVAGTLDVTGVMTTTAASVLGDGSTLAAATTVGDGDRTIVDLAYAESGTSVMHDTEGGYQNADVNGSRTKVYTKYLTGTLDADSATDVAHGVSSALTKILSVSVAAFEDTTNSMFELHDFRTSAAASVSYKAGYDGTNVKFFDVGSSLQGNNYRIRVDYIL